MFDFFKNTFLNRNRYKTHSKAVIISCFYNPMNNPYRLLAFQKWYHSIRHLNHRIIECLIGPDAKPQLPKSEYIRYIRTESLLFHKEALLNKIISSLPDEYRYVFWVDADVLFTNDNWLVDGVEQLQTSNLIQPFEFCIHLNKNQTKPDFDVDTYRNWDVINYSGKRHKRMWRSFCSNYVEIPSLSSNENYDIHGHVGFAWAARREVLDRMPLYDRGLIGGADHLMAHAAAGQIPHPCINKSFKDDLEEVIKWSQAYYNIIQGRIGYVSGDLYHIWHGDISDRQYLKRIQDFTGESKNIKEKDKHGLYVAKGDNRYMKKYYRRREVTQIDEDDFDGFDVGFVEDMGYLISDIFDLFGQPSYDDGDDDSSEVQGEPPILEGAPDAPPETHHDTAVTESSTAYQSENFS